MWSILGVAFVALLMKLSKLYENLPYLPCRDVLQRSEKVGNFQKSVPRSEIFPCG